MQRALSDHRWEAFARGYNGPNFAINQYPEKLKNAFQRFSQGGMPDLGARAAQLYLTYLDFNPGTIDGFAGPRTFSALNEFQQQQGLPVNNEINDDTIAALKQAALPNANAASP